MAIASVLLAGVLIGHGPIHPDMSRQMEVIADGSVRWAIVHWAAAASLSLFAITGLIVLTARSRLTQEWWTLSAWGAHGFVPGQWSYILSGFLRRTYAVVLLAALTFALRWRWKAAPWRDGAVLLWLGGAAVLAVLNKGGAVMNYLLPLYIATVVLVGRWWGSRTGPSAPEPSSVPLRRAGGVAALAACSLWLLATQTFILPSKLDEATARTFYGFVVSTVARERGPLLATCPDYAYYLVGQPVEIEGSSFPYLVQAGLTGTEAILQRLETGAYSLVVVVPQYWPWDDRYRAALEARYTNVGGCRLGYFYGHVVPFMLFVRRESAATFEPPSSVRCWSASPAK